MKEKENKDVDRIEGSIVMTLKRKRIQSYSHSMIWTVKQLHEI